MSAAQAQKTHTDNTQKPKKAVKITTILDIIAAFLTLTLFCVFVGLDKIPAKFFFWLLIGIGLGLIWEITHMAIPNFISVKNVNGVGIKCIYPIAHAIWDGFLLLISALIVFALHVPMQSCYALLIMMMFGFTQEILVELIGNGRFWQYDENFAANPVLFRIGKIGYTLWPLLEWILAPILFWLCIRWF
jgi:hypothetical protein